LFTQTIRSKHTGIMQRYFYCGFVHNFLLAKQKINKVTANVVSKMEV